jgi:hypothetical protein
MKKVQFLILNLFLAFLLRGQSTPKILLERDRAETINGILADRFDNLLPQLMQRTGFDMWIIISREYNEDPIMRTMLPAEWLSARRRTVMVFSLNTEGGKVSVEKLAIARYDVGLLKAAWDINVYPDQWEALIDLIKTKNPKKIGVNVSPNYAHSDGLSHHEYETLMSKMPENMKNRVGSAEKLAVSWLETRTEKEMQLYEQIARISHQIVREGFSDRAIQVGVTSTEDLVWWYRQRVRDLGLETWFQPSVAIQRADTASFDHLRAFSKRDYSRGGFAAR